MSLVLILTESGNPRREKTINAVVLTVLFAPMMWWSLLEYRSEEIQLSIVVAIMQINTVKLLMAQTNLAPIIRHSGSTRKEPTPRTTYTNGVNITVTNLRWDIQTLKTLAIQIDREFLLNSIANQMHLLGHHCHKLSSHSDLHLDPHGKLHAPSSQCQKEKRETMTTAKKIKQG